MAKHPGEEPDPDLVTDVPLIVEDLLGEALLLSAEGAPDREVDELLEQIVDLRRRTAPARRAGRDD